MVPAIGAGLIGAGASLAGGIVSALGQGAANRASVKLAREQMAFQERMRNTEWQSAVKDMQLAGLNPALAYEKGGASSPSGATAPQQNVLGAAATTGAQAAQVFSSISLQQAQAKKTNAEADYVASLAQSQLDMARMNMRQTGVNTAAAQRALDFYEETFGQRAKQILYDARLRELDAQFKHESMEDRLKAAGLEPKLRAQELDLRGLSRNEAEMWSKFYGGMGGELTPWLGTAGSILKMFMPMLGLLGGKGGVKVTERMGSRGGRNYDEWSRSWYE